MAWMSSVVSWSSLILAALSGCAQVDRALDAGDALDGSGQTAGKGGDGLVTAGKGVGLPPGECPGDYPAVGLPCLVPQRETCTYRGDGPCSTTNPDRIAVCVEGKWARVGPAIACPPLDCDRPLTLDDFCDRPGRDCSVSLEAMTASYCESPYPSGVRLQQNDCSGVTLLTRLGNSGSRYDYDGSGAIRAIQSYDDVPYGACKKTQYAYGTPCELIGMPVPACDAPATQDDAGT